MNISIWDLFKYVYKWKFVIIALIIVSMLAGYVYVAANQTYTASTIIKLNDECVSDGHSPDGGDFDCYEIVSPNVLTDVINELGLDKTVDSLRTRITITPIIPDSETKIQESKEKTGEKYDYHPNIFAVEYTGRGDESNQTVRNILDSVIKNYMKFYTSKYSNVASINDIAYSDEMGNYDYLDMALMLDDNISAIISNLNKYYERDDTFRSSTTGYTFSDMVKEYKYLQNFELAEILTDITKGQITTNKDLLIKRYTQKKEKCLTERIGYLDDVDVAKSRLQSFSEANKDVPNAYNEPSRDRNDDDMEIIDGLYKEINPYKTVTTYDELMNAYITSSISANNLLLDAERYGKIADFSFGSTDTFDTGALETKISENIEDVNLKLINLNKTANLVIEDFNKYILATHVSPLTGVNYYANLSAALYMLIAVVASAFLGIVLALTVEIIKHIKKEEKEPDDENPVLEEAK